MLRLRDRRVRISLVVVLVLLLGLSAYPIGRRVWASREYDAAGKALERYDYWQASAHLENYLSVCPTNSDGLFLAAQTARRRGDFNEAQRRLRQAEKHGAAAEAVATERQLLRLHQGDLTDVSSLARFCSDHPDDPEAVLAFEVMIEGNLRAFNLNGARWAIDLWLAYHPGPLDQAQGLVWRGRTNEFAQDSAQARADFERAVELAPEHAQARIHLVEVLLRAEPNKAAPHLEWLSSRRPGDPEVRLQTARLHRTLGQPEEAGRLLDAILESTPEMVSALVERGRIALDLNRPQDAERWLRRALALAPGLREVNLALGDCLRQLGQLDEAKHYQDVVQEIDAKLSKALEEKTRKGGPTSPQE